MDEQINSISSQKINSLSTRNFSFGLIAVLSFLLPIFFIPIQTFSFLAGKDALLITFVFLLLVAWFLQRAKNRDFSFSKNLFVISAMLVPFSYLLSSLFSGSLRASLLGFSFGVNSFVMILTFFLFMFLVARLFLVKKKVIYLYVGLLFSAIFMLFFHLLRLIFGPDFLSFGILNLTSSNLIGSWSDFGVFFGLIAVISLLTINFMRENKVIKIIGYVTLIGSLFFVALVNTFSLWLMLFLATLAIIIYNFFAIKKKESESIKKNIPVTSLVVLVISLFFVITVSLGSSIGSFLPSMFKIQNSEVRPSFGSTIDVVQASLAVDPILGKGLDGFSKQWSISKPIGINNTQFWNLDFNTGANFILTSLVTVGLLGFLSWVMFFGLIIYSGLKLLKGSHKNQFDHYISFSVFFATIYLWSFSVVSTPGVVIFALSFLFTGVLLALLYQERIVKVKKFSLPKNTGKGIVLIVIVAVLFLSSAFGFFLFVKKVNASIKAQKSLIVLNTEGDLGKSLELMVGAIGSSKNDLYYRLLSEMSLLQLQSVLNQKDITEEALAEQFQAIFTNARVSAEMAVNLDLRNYQNWVTLGKVYGTVVPLKVIEGAYDEAIKYYGNAISLSPINPSLALALANLEIANGDEEKAKGYIGSAIQLKNNYTEAYYLLAQIESANGNEEETIKIIEALAEQTPNDPEVQLQLGLFKYNVKNYEEAIPYFEKALGLNPTFIDAAYLLGLSYNGVGRLEEAINLFTSLQQALPEDQNMPVILENIKAGRDPLFGLEQQPQQQPMETSETESSLVSEDSLEDIETTEENVPSEVE